jgi:UDP-N-acetylmuramoyl-L-alanyl-D-glutamate--2,6-diaminopimelate ligase
MSIRKKIRSIIPKKILQLYHACMAILAVIFYRFPGKNLTVIGVTGTKGKTTTSNFIWSILSTSGYKTGLIGTAVIRINDELIPNEYHMTMPGPWVLQNILRKMVDRGCTHVIMEATSEGLDLYRHIGIPFKIAVFTNLSPEHIESHGNFENYKKAKAKLFKVLSGKKNTLSIVNADSEHGKYFGSFNSGETITYGLCDGDIKAENLVEDDEGVSFKIHEQSFRVNTIGAFNVCNALPAIALARFMKIPYAKVDEGLKMLKTVPGRMEKISIGQPFFVIVDYAHENLSINTVLDTARRLNKTNGNIIAVVGACGGGRDKIKREHIGRAAGTKADYVIVTNEDPFDDDPKELVDEVASFALQSGKIEDVSLFKVIDRKKAIEKALNIARTGDIVLVTGKGSEQSIVVGNEKIPWDDRIVVTEILEKLGYKK